MRILIAEDDQVLADGLMRSLRHRAAKGRQPIQPCRREDDAPRAGVARGVLARDDAPGDTLIDQIAHGLLGHARRLRQLGQAGAFERQVARQVDVRSAHLVARGQMRQRQRSSGGG